MIECVPKTMKGEVSIFAIERPDEVLYHRKNVICNTVSSLFARLLTANTEPVAGVWGLAVGAGGTGAQGWSASTQPDPTANQTAMVSEIKRKALSQVQFLDTNGNPTTTITNTVTFLTILNEETDNISVPIREMGLIGGGTTVVANGGPTNMLTAPYYDPANPEYNTVTLVNYVTTPPFILPAGINMGILWKLTF